MFHTRKIVASNIIIKNCKSDTLYDWLCRCCYTIYGRNKQKVTTFFHFLKTATALALLIIWHLFNHRFTKCKYQNTYFVLQSSLVLLLWLSHHIWPFIIYTITMFEQIHLFNSSHKEENKQQTNLQSISSKEFIKANKNRETNEALTVANRYEKLINRQNYSLNNYEREHGKPMTNQDIENIEGRVTQQIEILTTLYKQGRVEEYGMKFWQETLRRARQHGTNRTKTQETEDNKHGVIFVGSLDESDEVTQDNSLCDMIDEVNNTLVLSLINNIVWWDDYVFMIDYLNNTIDRKWSNKMKYSRLLAEAKDRTKHIRRTDEEIKQQAIADERTAKATTKKIKAHKAKHIEAVDKRVFTYKKRLAQFNKADINLVSLAKQIKEGTYSVARADLKS